MYPSTSHLTTNCSTTDTCSSKRLFQSLLQLVQTSRRLPIGLPPEIIDYVERSRNPDIYTREFVELVQRLNQQLKGRSEAYADFRDALAREMTSALPDCRDDIRKIMESTGGKSLKLGTPRMPREAAGQLHEAREP